MTSITDTEVGGGKLNELEPPAMVPFMRAWLAWSSGKDSAWTLQVLRQQREHRVEALLTTLNDEQGRVAMHGVRRSLLRAQAEAVGLPCIEIPLPWPCTNADYEHSMSIAFDQAAKQGIEAIAFGDLFLEDVRAYRVRQLEGTGLAPLFPLWGLDTNELARLMIDAGLRARLTCIDSRSLDPSFSGRDFDETLLRDLPDGVDACGERGEFHSFVYAGPMFDRELSIHVGERVQREDFIFTDLALVRAY